MKKTLITLFIAFVSQFAFAQSSKTVPAITPAFTDSITVQVKRIIAPDFGIKILYTSMISSEGKLLRPLIFRQINESENSNDIVVQLRLLLLAAPAWKPAFDNTLNKAVDDEVWFTIIIQKGKVSIEKVEKGTKLK